MPPAQFVVIFGGRVLTAAATYGIATKEATVAMAIPARRHHLVASRRAMRAGRRPFRNGDASAATAPRNSGFLNVRVVPPSTHERSTRNGSAVIAAASAGGRGVESAVKVFRPRSQASTDPGARTIIGV